eukprot:4752435-Amphidinium_carterae.1
MEKPHIALPHRQMSITARMVGGLDFLRPWLLSPIFRMLYRACGGCLCQRGVRLPVHTHVISCHGVIANESSHALSTLVGWGLLGPENVFTWGWSEVTADHHHHHQQHHLGLGPPVNRLRVT